MRLHWHHKDHVRCVLDVHLVNTFQPHFGNEDTVFCHFCSHSTLLGKGFCTSMIAYKAVDEWFLSVEHPLRLWCRTPERGTRGGYWRSPAGHGSVAIGLTLATERCAPGLSGTLHAEAEVLTP